jgi:hypothetical protein
MSVRNVYGYVRASTDAVINIYYGSVGSTTTLLNHDLILTTTGDNTTSFSSTTLSAGTWLMLRVVSITDNPGILTVSIAFY